MSHTKPLNNKEFKKLKEGTRMSHIKYAFPFLLFIVASALHLPVANAQTVALSLETSAAHARDTRGNLLLLEGTDAPLPPDIDGPTTTAATQTTLTLGINGLIRPDQTGMKLRNFDWFVLRVSITERQAGLIQAARPNFGTAPNARVVINPPNTEASTILLEDVDLSRPAVPASSDDLEHAVYSIFFGGPAISASKIADLVPATCFDPTSANQSIYTGDSDQLPQSLLEASAPLTASISIASANNNRDFHGDQRFAVAVTRPCASNTLRNLPPNTFMSLPAPIAYRMRDDDVPYVTLNPNAYQTLRRLIKKPKRHNNPKNLDTLLYPLHEVFASNIEIWLQLVRGRNTNPTNNPQDDDFLIVQPNYSSVPLRFYIGVRHESLPSFPTLKYKKDFVVTDVSGQPIEPALGPILDAPFDGVASTVEHRYFLAHAYPDTAKSASSISLSGPGRFTVARLKILDDNVYENVERLEFGLNGVFVRQEPTITYEYPHVFNAEGYIVERAVLSDIDDFGRGVADSSTIEVRVNKSSALQVSVHAFPRVFTPGATVRIGYFINERIDTDATLQTMLLKAVVPGHTSRLTVPCGTRFQSALLKTNICKPTTGYPAIGPAESLDLPANISIDKSAVPNQFIEVAHVIFGEDGSSRDFEKAFMKWTFSTLGGAVPDIALRGFATSSENELNLRRVVLRLNGASLTHAGAVIAVPSGQSVPTRLTQEHIALSIFEPNPPAHCVGNNPRVRHGARENSMCVRPEQVLDLYGVLLDPSNRSLQVVNNTTREPLALPFDLPADDDYTWQPSASIIGGNNGARTPLIASGESSVYLGTLTIKADTAVEQDEVIALKVATPHERAQHILDDIVVVQDYFSQTSATSSASSDDMHDENGVTITILDSDRRFYPLISLPQTNGSFEGIEVPATLNHGRSAADIANYDTIAFFGLGGNTLEFNDMDGGSRATLGGKSVSVVSRLGSDQAQAVSVQHDFGASFEATLGNTPLQARFSTSLSGDTIFARYAFDGAAVTAGNLANYTFNKNFVFTPDADEAPGIAPLVMQLAEPPVGMGGTNDPTFALPVRFLSDAQIAANKFATSLPPEYANVGALNASTPIIGVANSTATYSFQASSDMTMLLQFVLTHPSNPLPTDISTLALTLKRGDTTLGRSNVLQTADITSHASKLYIGFAGQTRSLRDGGTGLQGVQCNNDALRSNPELVSADDNAYFMQAIHDGDRDDLSEYTLEVAIPPSASAYYGENASWLEIRSEIACVQGPVEDNPVSTDDIVYANFHSVPCTASVEGLADPAVCALATQQLRYTDDDFLISAIEASDVTLDGDVVLESPVPAVLTEHPAMSGLTGYLRGIRLTLDIPYVALEHGPGTLPRITLLFSPSGPSAERVLLNPHADGNHGVPIGTNPAPVTEVVLRRENDLITASAVFSLTPDNIYDPDAVLKIAIPPVTAHPDARTASLDLLIADKNNHIIGAPCQNAHLSDTVCEYVVTAANENPGIIQLQYGGSMREDYLLRVRFEWNARNRSNFSLASLVDNTILPERTLPNGRRSVIVDTLMRAGATLEPVVAIIPTVRVAQSIVGTQDDITAQGFTETLQIFVEDDPLQTPNGDAYAQGLGTDTTSTVIITTHPTNVFPSTYNNIGPTQSRVEGDEGQSASYILRAAAGVSIAMRMNGTWHEDAQISIGSEDAITNFDSVQLTGADLGTNTDNVVYLTFYDDRLPETDAPATCAGINLNNQLLIPHTDTSEDALSEYTIEISIPEDEGDHYYNMRRAITIEHAVACVSLNPGTAPNIINLECESVLLSQSGCSLGTSESVHREVAIDYRDNDGYIDTLVLRDADRPDTSGNLDILYEADSVVGEMPQIARAVLVLGLPGMNLSGAPLRLSLMAHDLSAIAERTVLYGTSTIPKSAPLSIPIEIAANQSTMTSDVFTVPANMGYQPQTSMSVTYLGATGATVREFSIRDAADNLVGLSVEALMRADENIMRGHEYPIVLRLAEPVSVATKLRVAVKIKHTHAGETDSDLSLNGMEHVVAGMDAVMSSGPMRSLLVNDTYYEIQVALDAGASEAHAFTLSYPGSVYDALDLANITTVSVTLSVADTSATALADITRAVAAEAMVAGLQQSEVLTLYSTIPAILGFLPGDLNDPARPNFDTYPSVLDESAVIGHDNAIPFALSVLASDQLGNIDVGINQTDSDLTIVWEARLLLDGEEVTFNDLARPNPYSDYLVLLDADGNELGMFSTLGTQITTVIPAEQSTVTFAWAIRDEPSITPTRALELDQLSVRLRITSAVAGRGSSFASVRADASNLSYTLRDTTRLPLGFEFISATSGEDGSIPTTQGQYADILPNLNNLAMFNAEHGLPEGAIIQFRPRLEDDGVAAPYRVVGRAGKFIDIPLLFEAGTHTPRFGGAFVALRNMDATQIDDSVVDNRCRLLEARDAANDAININHTVDYCLQQRGLASANARRILDSMVLLGDTTGTSTVLADDANGVSQLSLRLVAGATLNTVAGANNPADDPFTHLLMGMVIAAPHLPTTLDEAISEVVPATQANYDLTLEPDEHFVMRWSTTDTRIVEADSIQRRFIIRGHSPQNVLSYSERFTQAEFGLSEPSTDALRYIPHYQTQIFAVPESQTLTLALRVVGDTPTDIPTASNVRANQALYYTDTVAREFSLRLTTVTNTITAALPQSLQIGNAVLPATATPTPLQLQFTITGLEDLNAINEQYGFDLREVTANLPSDISDSARLILSNTGIPLSLLSEDDDLPPAINLSYRLFDLDANPYTNTAGTLTQNTLDGYRVQGSAAIVPVARDATNQNLLDTATMPHFPDSLSRYRFGVDFPEHDLSVRAPPALGTIVGRGAYLAELDNQPIDLAPHFELYAVFITPEADAFNYLTRNGASDNPATPQSLNFAGLAHPHNLDASAATISAAPVGTRQARDNDQISPALRNVLGTSAEHIMLFARLSHNPDDLDTFAVLARVAEHCPVIADADADALGAEGEIIVSINDHRHATGSADKLEQPFSILNILGIDDSDTAALYQYGYRENIATMNIALLCASDPSLSPDLNDNLNADGSAGPEYCATRMVDGYCQVGTYNLNYTDYLPELYNPDLIQGGASFYMHRAHNAPLYEADVNAGISAGYEGAGDPTNCQNADADPAQRCNQLSWLIQAEPRLQVGFYGTHSRSELLRHTPRVNTQADDARLQWAIVVTTANTAITGDLVATQLIHSISTGRNQDNFDNPNRGPAHLPTDLADSLTLLTAVLPSNVNTFADLSFATQINANDQYRHCALLFTSADAVQACANQNIQPQQLRFEPSLITRVYDAQNRPSVISHPVIADTSTATITIADPDVYVLLESSSSDGVLDEANPGEDGRFVEISARFGGISDTNMADRLDLALIFYTDTNTALQLHAETSNTNTATPFFAGVTNPAKASSDLVVQARGKTAPYGGLWSAPEMNIGSADANPLALTLFADEAGLLLESSSVTSSVDLNDEATINAHPILGTNRVLLALRYPAIAPSDQPQLLARVYVNADDDIEQGTRSLRVALGVLGASDSIGTGALQSLDYLQVTDPEDSSSMVRVNTAESIGTTYLSNYLGLQEADAMAFATPVTQEIRLLDDDATGISIINTPSGSNILVEQDIVSAAHQIRFTNLDAPYLDGADTLITPTNVGVLLRLDFSVPNDARVSPNNMFSVRLRDTDNSNNDADTRLIGALATADDPNPVYVLWGDPNFVSDNCAGIDLSNDINPIEVGSSADRTQDAGTSLTLEIFATGGQTDPDFYGDQAIVYTPHVLCSNHQLFDAHVDNRALTGHACKRGTSSFIGTLSTLVVGTETLDACALANSPIIDVVETAQIDIAINAELTGGFSVSHAFSSNLIFNALEPDAVRPAIERAAIPANGIILRATLSDGATNRSGSAIALNHVSNQLNQFATQLTFTPDPTFSTSRGIPDGANGVVIGTILPLEDELMEGDIDYPLLMAGATDYIVATRASTIRSQIHTQLPLVDNPLTDAPEQQAADYVFRMALDLDNPTVAAQVQNAVLPTMRVIDADDYFHYLVEGPAIDTAIVAEAVLNQFSEADAPVVNLRIGLGGTHIAWGGNNPTAIIGEAIMREMMVQALSDAEFNAAAFLDSETPTHTDRSLFIHTDSTADHQGASRDVTIELPNGAVNIVRESNTALASYRSNQAWWQLRFDSDIFAEGDEYIEIALSMREANPTNPAMPRALRRLGPATHLRYQLDEIDPELFLFAQPTAISSQQNRYPLPIISEYLASDVVAGEPSVHATVSTLAVTTFAQDGMVVQLDVYGHLANRDGDLILGRRAYATDETIPQSRLGDAVQIADTSVRRFYLQLGNQTPACLAASGITTERVFETSAPVIGANGLIEFPIGLGTRRPGESHASVHYGGTRVLRLSASVLCSDDSHYPARTSAMHAWQDPTDSNSTITDTRGIPVLLRDRADEFTLSYFVATTDSLPQAGFTPRTQFGLHEAGVARPFPNTLAQLHVHAALMPTSASFGDAPIIPASDLQAPIPISAFRTISTGICEGAEDCIPEPDTNTNNYYLGSIRAGADNSNTWEPNSQLQLIGAGTRHESTADFASEWLLPNSAIVLDPIPQSTETRNALLLPSAPSVLFDNRVFNAPAAILSSIAPQRIMLQDAQSYISMSVSTPRFTIRAGVSGGLPVAEFEINLGGVPTQTPVERLTNLPSPLQIQLGFVFGFTTPTTNSSKARPSFSIEGASEQFIANSDPDARDPAMLTLTPTLGFDTGDSYTTSTLTIDNGHYFEASLTVSDNPSLTSTQQRRVVLRVVHNDAFDANLIRYGTLQAHLVVPPADADYYIYPENDPIAPSAVNLMIDNVDASIISCAVYTNSVSVISDYEQPYPRDCLRVRSRSTYAFTVDTMGLEFVIPFGSTDDALIPIHNWSGAFIRVHYYSPDDATTACDIPPVNGPLPSDNPYLSGRYASNTVFEPNTNVSGLNFTVDARDTGPSGAHYCVVLEANTGGASAFTLPVRVELPEYSTDDDNDNGLPDDIEVIDPPVGSSPTIVYIRDYCRRVGSLYDPDLGARNDCDNDGAPDLAELQYGPPEDNNDYTLMRALCIAEGFYTRFPRVDLGNLLCTDAAGDQAAATQTIAAIDSDWLLAIRGNDYAGVALEIASAGPPNTFRADNGLLPANRYWFVDSDDRHMAEIFVAPALRFRTPSRVPSDPTGYQIDVRKHGFYPLSVILLGHISETMGASVALEFEGYSQGNLIATHSDELQFRANSGLSQDIGTYRMSTAGAVSLLDDNPISHFFNTPGMSSATVTLNHAVHLDEPNHPLHGTVLHDHRRHHERYEIGMVQEEIFDASGAPQPAGLQLINPPSEDLPLDIAEVSTNHEITSSVAETILDFALRDNGILTQNAGVLYLGPHPDINSPTTLSSQNSMMLKEALRAQFSLSLAYQAKLLLISDSRTQFNTSQTWSLLPSEEGAREIVLYTGTGVATDSYPFTLPDTATLCNMLPTCQSKTGGVDYVRLLYRLYDLDESRPLALAYIWLQLGGDAAQMLDDRDEDGVPEAHGDIEGVLSLPFSASGAHGSIVVEQQQVALQLGTSARAQHQTDPAFAQGANLGSGDILDLDFHLSCIDHADQSGGAFYEANPNSDIHTHDILLDISGHALDAFPAASNPRDDVFYDACLGYEVPVLIRLPESMAVASDIDVSDSVAGFAVKSYSFSAGLPDGSCPQANAQSDWWQPDGEAPRASIERCMRLILEGDPDLAGLPLMTSALLTVPMVPMMSVDLLQPTAPYINGDSGGGGIIDPAQLLLILCMLVFLLPVRQVFIRPKNKTTKHT